MLYFNIFCSFYVVIYSYFQIALRSDYRFVSAVKFGPTSQKVVSPKIKTTSIVYLKAKLYKSSTLTSKTYRRRLSEDSSPHVSSTARSKPYELHRDRISASRLPRDQIHTRVDYREIKSIYESTTERSNPCTSRLPREQSGSLP